LPPVKQATVSVENMKMRIIKLDPDFLVKAIQGKAAALVSNLPGDAELLDIKYDLFAKQVFAIVRSDSFEAAADTYPIPELNVAYASGSKVETKPGPKPAVIAKPEPRPAPKTPTPTSQDVRAVEAEFSPEQLELLSFSIDGDYIVVKPVQYLKDEWNEINDVVRSLGGTWVKGDFASYWEIPLQQSQQTA
jgi:hypothetical protein